MPAYRLIRFPELDSTNAYARAHLETLADRDVIEADVQSAGRGRLDRRWVSHVPRNLYVSLVLKPAGLPPAQLPLANLSQLLALCVCRALNRHGAPATLKWPNDILVDQQKIAGILAESVVQGTQFLGLILGLGINLNHDAPTLAALDQPATALNLILRRPVDAPAFRDVLLDEFFRHYPGFLSAGFPSIRQEYLRAFPWLGSPSEVRGPAGTRRGIARDIDDQGRLTLVDDCGQVHSLTLGEMFPPPEPTL